MTARPLLEWSDGAAGPVLRLTPVADPRKVTWRDFALCAEADPEAWFPDIGEPSAPAKAICAACFVRSPVSYTHLDVYKRQGHRPRIFAVAR